MQAISHGRDQSKDLFACGTAEPHPLMLHFSYLWSYNDWLINIKFSLNMHHHLDEVETNLKVSNVTMGTQNNSLELGCLCANMGHNGPWHVVESVPFLGTVQCVLHLLHIMVELSLDFLLEMGV